MVDQIASMILISTVLTFIGLLSASFLMKLGNITHPKSKFFIYFIVVLTAAALIFVPLFSTNLSSITDTDSSKIQTQCSEKESPPVSLMVSYGDEQFIFQSPLETIITETSETPTYEDEKSDVSTDNSTDSSLQRAVCVAILYEKFFKNNKEYTFNHFLDKYNLQLDEEKIQQSSVSTILTEIIALQTNSSLSDFSSSPITCKFVLNSEQQDKKECSVAPASTLQDEQPFPPIYFGLLFLIIIGVLYFVFSITLGKKLTLKTLHAEQCNNQAIRSLIHAVSDELGIKPPRIFIAQGIPNAFVFGYPITLVLSKSLLSLLTKKELEMTIRHELSHIKNKDIIIKPALQMLRIFLFFNPFVHIAVHRMIQEREVMADVVSFSNKKDKITFMEALIKIEEYLLHFPSKSRSFSPLSAPSLWDHTKKQQGLEDRFNRLFEDAHPKRILSIFVGILLLVTNLSLFAAAYQMATPEQEIHDTNISEGCTPKNESYIYECTFIIGNEDITCQEVVMFISGIDKGNWIQYQTEVIPLAPYLFTNSSLYVYPQPDNAYRSNPIF